MRIIRLVAVLLAAAGCSSVQEELPPGPIQLAGKFADYNETISGEIRPRYTGSAVFDGDPRGLTEASLIMLRSQGGSQTRSILALFTSGIDSIRRCTSPGNDPATGQAGVVSVMRTFTTLSGCTSIA